MPKDDHIPDAWDDDDWEEKADRAAKERSKAPAPQPEPPMTRAALLAKHREEQRKLWESAYVRRTRRSLRWASRPF